MATLEAPIRVMSLQSGLYIQDNRPVYIFPRQNVLKKHVFVYIYRMIGLYIYSPVKITGYFLTRLLSKNIWFIYTG